jgi:N-acetylglucosamine-6-phosphate deacetylase
MKTKLLIEQHFHGAFGVDFNTAGVDDVLYLAKEIRKYGIGGIFPTLVTDSVENIQRQTKIIKQAAQRQTDDMARILGVHLEGIFINPLKKGIHDEKYFLALTEENFGLVADEFVKIATIAPELVPRPLAPAPWGRGDLKFQAGHCVGGDLSGCDGVTHIFNAMEGISHKKPSTALTALVNDGLYVEVIADGVHLSDDILKLIFKSKPADKVILVSDSLSCAKTPPPNPRPQGAGGPVKFNFAGSEIYYDGAKATSKDGVLAGSTALLPDIIKSLAGKGMFNPQFIENPYRYHGVDIKGEIEWDEDFNIVKII